MASAITATRHRGPNNQSQVEIEPGALRGVLAHARLATIDLSQGGQQRFRGPLRSWIEARLFDGPLLTHLGVLEQHATYSTWTAYLAGESSCVSHCRIWRLAALADWCQRHRMRA
jgi:hypothetical protein